jgi:hypothetical protein
MVAARRLAGHGSGRRVAWLARLLGVQEVVSSNLTAPTIFFPGRFSEKPACFSRRERIEILQVKTIMSPGPISARSRQLPKAA